jgi:hypothetical protein
VYLAFLDSATRERTCVACSDERVHAVSLQLQHFFWGVAIGVTGKVLGVETVGEPDEQRTDVPPVEQVGQPLTSPERLVVGHLWVGGGVGHTQHANVCRWLMGCTAAWLMSQWACFGR